MKALFACLILVCIHANIFEKENSEHGFIQLEDKKHEIFYWLFKARNPKSPVKPTLVLWLEGGPGCSSIICILLENGPYRLNDDGKITNNTSSWNNNVDILFVDQPLGTGFSNCDDRNRMPKDEAEVFKDFIDFFKKFLTKHTEYDGSDFYLTGHSYGGHYVPYFGTQFIEKKLVNLNLKGVAIGNGYFNSATQSLSYPDFNRRHHLLNSTIKYAAAKVSFFFVNFFTRLNWFRAAHLFFFVGYKIGNGYVDRFSMYNIKKLKYNSDALIKLMNRDDVRTELNAVNKKWVACSTDVFDHMIDKDMYANMGGYVEKLLDKRNNLRVVLYSGNLDWICNIDSVLTFLKEINWDGKEEFIKDNWREWRNETARIGSYNKGGSLTFFQTDEAGHMVARDRPDIALKVLNELLNPTV